MSVLEKKAIAFEKLASIIIEEDIDEILKHLESLVKEPINLSKHLNSISERYNETLKKLAQ